MKRLTVVCCAALLVSACRKTETIAGPTMTTFKNPLVTIYSGPVTAGTDPIPGVIFPPTRQRIPTNADPVNHPDTDGIQVSLCKGAVCDPPPGIEFVEGSFYVDLIDAPSSGYTFYTIVTTVSR